MHLKENLKKKIVECWKQILILLLIKFTFVFKEEVEFRVLICLPITETEVRIPFMHKAILSQ